MTEEEEELRTRCSQHLPLRPLSVQGTVGISRPETSLAGGRGGGECQGLRGRRGRCGCRLRVQPQVPSGERGIPTLSSRLPPPALTSRALSAASAQPASPPPFLPRALPPPPTRPQLSSCARFTCCKGEGA